MSGVNTRFERAKSRLSKTLIQISLWPWTSSRNLIYCGATQGEHQESGTYAVPCIQVRVKQLHLNLLRYITLHPPRCLRCCGTVLSPSLATPPPTHTHTNGPMSLRCCEWRVWFHGQTTFKPSIPSVSSYSLQNFSGSLKKKLSDGGVLSG